MADPSVHVGLLARPVRETVHPDHGLDEAEFRFIAQGGGGASVEELAVVPVGDGDEIVGVVVRADLRRARDRDGAAQVTVRQIMTTGLAFCYQHDHARTARSLMDRHACDHLLVVDSDRCLVGILAREDLPPTAEGEVRSEPLEQREESTQGIASTIQPGGLDVYADRPTIKKSRRRRKIRIKIFEPATNIPTTVAARMKQPQ